MIGGCTMTILEWMIVSAAGCMVTLGISMTVYVTIGIWREIVKGFHRG